MAKLTDLHLRILEKEALDCCDVTELLGDYADDDLTGTLRARIDGHILTCPQCAEVRDTYLLTIKIAKSLRHAVMPAGVSNRLRSALNQRLGLNLSLTAE